jgi:hypothetical protein
MSQQFPCLGISLMIRCKDEERKACKGTQTLPMTVAVVIPGHVETCQTILVKCWTILGVGSSGAHLQCLLAKATTHKGCCSVSALRHSCCYAPKGNRGFFHNPIRITVHAAVQAHAGIDKCNVILTPVSLLKGLHELVVSGPWNVHTCQHLTRPQIHLPACLLCTQWFAPREALTSQELSQLRASRL